MKKTKRIAKRLPAVGIALAAFLMGTSPLYVQAAPKEPKADEVVCTCDKKCDEEHVNEECEVCAYDYTFCQAPEPIVTGKEDLEKEVGSETDEKYGPLTPDGNMELVDDYGEHPETGKQFITILTKSGHYFYIIIDRDDKGAEIVHFLNKVDEADLLALMEDDEVKEYEAEKKAAEEAEGEVLEETSEETSEGMGLIKLPSFGKKDKEKDTTKKKSSMTIPVLVILGIGAAVLGFMVAKKKKGSKPKNTGKDPDADYTEEDYFDSLPKEEDDYDLPDIEDEESEGK